MFTSQTRTVLSLDPLATYRPVPSIEIRLTLALCISVSMRSTGSVGGADPDAQSGPEKATASRKARAIIRVLAA